MQTLQKNAATRTEKELKEYSKETKTSEERIERLDKIIESLYEDNIVFHPHCFTKRLLSIYYIAEYRLFTCLQTNFCLSIQHGLHKPADEAFEQEFRWEQETKRLGIVNVICGCLV